MADGWSEADILASYSGITRRAILACLSYARDTLSSESFSDRSLIRGQCAFGLLVLIKAHVRLQTMLEGVKRSALVCGRWGQARP
ncbi:DUF433 domain-containing protein [Rhodopila sp.]|uniref:DUF433 domain-containing protein n=1 Tax=Rhodopila sp. TaxID=2480087 RepID=UPI003D0B9E9F